jgi:putative PIN family toxin of toxin-antitoxin system
MSKCRVVFDTGVLISAALLPQSVPRHAVDITVAQGCLLFSDATIAELHDVFRRPKFARYVSEQRRIEFLLTLIDGAEIHEVSREIRHCRDPKDDKFLELATTGQATHIVSGDSDLLVFGSYEGIPIVAPAEFAAMVGTNEP